MIYIFAGDDTRYITYRAIKENFNLEPLIFDGSINEELENFKESILSLDLFQIKRLLILKNAHKIKNIEEFINNNLSKSYKDIIIDLEDDGKIEKKILKNDNIKIIFSIDDKSNSKKIDYISKNLKLNKFESKEILNLIDSSFFNLENEINKIKSLSLGNDLSFEDIKNSLSLNFDSDLIKAAETIIDKKSDLSKYIDFLPLLYTILTIIKLCLKIKLLDLNSDNYFNFSKEIYPPLKDKLVSHPYFVFKNIDRAHNLKESFIESMIFKLLELEYKIKIGELKDIEAIEALRLNFSK